MVLSYAQLLLVCFAFWSSRHAVTRALGGQWDMALPFGGTALLCLIVANAEWVILALVDGALLIAARRIETSRPSKPPPWIESSWGMLCMVTLLLMALLYVVTLGSVVPLGSLAAWLVDWLPLIALAGGVSAFLTRNDSPPPNLASPWPWWREKIKHATAVLIDCWHRRSLRPVWSELRIAGCALLLQRLTQSVSTLRRRLLTDVDRFRQALHAKFRIQLAADIHRFRQALQFNFRSLLADDLRRFKQALRSPPTVMPSPSFVISISKLGRLMLADLRRFRQVRSEILMLLVADVRRFKTAVGFPQALNVKLEQMRFYAPLPAGVKNTEPWYTTRFPQENISYILCEVTLRKVQRQYHRRYAAAFRCYQSDGSLFGEVRREWVIKAEWQSTWMSQGWGWPVRGYWPPGEYEAKFFLDEVVLGSGRFTLLPPPPPKPLAENLRLISVKFYAAQAISQTNDLGPGFELLKMWENIKSQKEMRQYNIRFPQETTGEVICELTVQNLLYQQRNQTYPLTAQCYTAEEKLLWENHHDWTIKSEEQESSISWGWQAPGQWEAGAYRVEILIEGYDFAWGVFLIEELS